MSDVGKKESELDILLKFVFKMQELFELVPDERQEEAKEIEHDLVNILDRML